MRVYKKDGIKYLFLSKFEIFNEPYGISKTDKKDIDTKILNTLNFYKNSYIEISGEQISFFDFSTSANIQPKRYHAELYNRISTMREFACDFGFDTPIFITLTAPSYLKPLKQVKLGKSKNIKLIDNPKFCGDMDFVKKSRDFISDSWRKFLRQRIFKEIKDEFKQNIMYLKVYEPHLDGCPHCHIVAFIPNKFKDRFVNLTQNYFKTKTDIKSEFDDKGGGVIAYLLKYVLKSFTHGKNGEICDVAYWYIFNNMRRFSTFRTLITMQIYRKIRHKSEFRDLKQMTNLFQDGFISCDLVADNKKFCTGEKLKSTDFIIDTIIVSIDGFDYLEHKIAYKRSDNVTVHLYDGKEIEVNLPYRQKSKLHKEKHDLNLKSSFYHWTLKPFSKMTNLELIDLYTKYDLEYFEPQRFGILENELLSRGLDFLTHKHEKHNLNDINGLKNDFASRGIQPLEF